MSRSISIFRRFMPLAVAALTGAFLLLGCVVEPEDPDGGEPYTPTVPTDGKSVPKLLSEGHKALEKQELDEAFAYYEAAYQKDGSDPEAIAYSTLAKLSKVSIEPKVVNLLKNRIGLKDYPTELNALLNPEDWLKAYPGERFDYYYHDDKLDTYVYWRDSYDVNNTNYIGVTKEGYYYQSGYEFNFVSNTPRYENALVYLYPDDDGNIVQWISSNDIRGGDYPSVVNKEGYWVQEIDWNTGTSTYVFVSNKAKYERRIVDPYYDNEDNEIRWLDEDDNDYEVDKEGYYRISGIYTSVNSKKRNLETYEQLFPGLDVPSWVKGGSGSVYGSTLIDGAPSVETWPIILLANLLDKNSNGLNDLLDETIAAIFGKTFDDICARIDKLKGSDVTFKLDAAFLEALNLEDNIFEDYDEIGWAELNAVVSFMTAIKASLEFVAAYDWNTNLNFLKFAWGEENIYDRVKNNLAAKDLPFNNSFLNARPGKMAAAKADFIKAIEGLQASYEAIVDSENEFWPTEMKEAYPTLNEGAGLLVAAIKNGGTFYIPDDATKGKWPTKGNKWINMGKLFQEGYFSLPNLFETSGGKPVFYADGTLLTARNYEDKIDEAGGMSLRFKTGHVTDIISGFDIEDVEDEDIPIWDVKLAKLLFEKYYGVSPSKKSRMEPLAKARPSLRK